MLRQFDVGFLEKAEREAVSVSNNNTMNIGTNLGALQQGSHGSTQNASFTLNISEIREALQKVQEELANVPQAVRAKLEPELETVMAQLKKETPSHSILRETGTTIRAIIEGIAGNILTPSFVAAVSALRAALGMG